MRKLCGKWRFIVGIICILASLYHLYTAGFGVLTPRLQRGIHLTFVLTIAFLLFPSSKEKEKRVTILDIVFSVLAFIVCSFVVFSNARLNLRWEHVTSVLPVEVFFGTIVILLLLEATRRAVSSALSILAGITLMYLVIGPYLKGILYHSGFSYPRIVELMYLLTDEGIFGIMTGISATYIAIFVLFGAFISTIGIGDFFIDFANALTGKAKGGPAKISVISSGLFGMISGIAVANVFATGSLSIPLMKKLGYRPQFAGAVEAAASTGGQYMPPIMGAAAFIMSEVTAIPYLEICIRAFASAVLYFVAVGFMVHFEALKCNLRGLKDEEIPNLRKTLRKSYLVIPVIALVYFLIRGYSPIMAAFVSILVAILTSLFSKESRLTFTKFIRTLELGTKNLVSVALACTCAGIIVSVITHTGLGLAFSSLILALTKGNFILVLLFTMTIALILGFGVPTTAAYILSSTLGAGLLIRLGVDLLAAHLFVFYFAIVACCTPPVAICAYAAASISGADPMKTGFESAKLAMGGFIIPYVFIFNPPLLIQGSALEVCAAIVISLEGVIIFAAALEGYLIKKIKIIERIILIGLGGILLFLVLPKFSPVISLLIGTVLFVGYMILNNKIIRTNLKENDTKLEQI